MIPLEPIPIPDLQPEPPESPFEHKENDEDFDEEYYEEEE